jgi:hypothetical protein
MAKDTVNPASLGQYISDPLAHFEAIPWCAKLLSDKRIVGRETPNRTKTADGNSTLINETLNSSSTVRACTSFFRYVKTPTTDALDNGEDKKNPFLEFVALVDLGSGMDGWKNLVHGGVQGVMLDEVMSNAAFQQARTFTPCIS